MPESEGLVDQTAEHAPGLTATCLWWAESSRRKAKQLTLRAAIENDVNLGALGERWRGTACGVRDFVFLAIGTGVGAGIFVDGRLYHGADWSAGEVCYVYVPGTGEIPLALLRPGPHARPEAAAPFRSPYSNSFACRVVFDGAGDGNRTHVRGLGSRYSTIEPRPLVS